MFFCRLMIGAYVTDIVFPAYGIGQIVSVTLPEFILIRFYDYNDLIQRYVLYNLISLCEINLINPMDKSNQSNLRVCSHCEWIFRLTHTDDHLCPKCGNSGSFGAYSVYKNNAYKLAKNQKKWLNRELDKYKAKLQLEIKNSFFFD